MNIYIYSYTNDTGAWLKTINIVLQIKKYKCHTSLKLRLLRMRSSDKQLKQLVSNFEKVEIQFCVLVCFRLNKIMFWVFLWHPVYRSVYVKIFIHIFWSILKSFEKTLKIVIASKVKIQNLAAATAIFNLKFDVLFSVFT